MGNKETVSHDPGLPAAVAFCALSPVRSTARGIEASVVAQDRAAPGLVECDPVLDLVCQSLVDDTGVVCIVGDEFLFVQHAAISLVELIGKIPVEEGDQGSDSRSQEVIDELDVVLKPFFVDRVIAASERDDTGPIK